jgi:hypothetical protein
MRTPGRGEDTRERGGWGMGAVVVVFGRVERVGGDGDLVVCGGISLFEESSLFDNGKLWILYLTLEISNFVV